jgi:hypothetical protein
VLYLTLLDNISGLRWKHSNDGELRNIKIEPFIILDNSQVILPPAPAELFVLHRQKTQVDEIWTWIGLYRAIPNRANNRKGDYCGVGLWLQNEKIGGFAATRILRDLMKVFFKSIESAARQSWDVTRAPVEGWARNVNPELGALDGRKEFGHESICIDASGGGESEIDEALDEIQEDGDGRFDRFCRILVSRDSAVVEAVRSRGRIPVKKLNSHPSPSQPQFPPSSQPQPPQPPPADGRLASSDLARLSSETSQANARIDDLSRALRELEGRGAPAPKRSWPGFLIGALVAIGVAALVVAVEAPDFLDLPLRPADGTAPLQSQIADLKSQVNKLQEALAAYKNERQNSPPAPIRTPTSEIAEPNPSSGAPPSGGSAANPPLPPIAPRPVGTMSAQELAKIVNDRSGRSGVPPPFVLVDVDGTGREKLPGAQLCMQIVKAARDPRCTERDLKPLWPDDSTLIFYGHDSGPHSAAADLASELAGVPNAIWYREGYDAWRKAVDDSR